MRYTRPMPSSAHATFGVQDSGVRRGLGSGASVRETVKGARGHLRVRRVEALLVRALGLQELVERLAEELVLLGDLRGAGGEELDLGAARGELLRPRQARTLLRQRSGVRRRVPSLRTVHGGRWVRGPRTGWTAFSTSSSASAASPISTYRLPSEVKLCAWSCIAFCESPSRWRSCRLFV